MTERNAALSKGRRGGADDDGRTIGEGVRVGGIGASEMLDGGADVAGKAEEQEGSMHKARSEEEEGLGR